MTPEAQRIAIAEACGWQDCKRATSVGRTLGKTVVGTNDHLQKTNREWKYDAVPDYLNDLNAMHEAEQVLTKSELELYFDCLANCVFHANPRTTTWTFRANAAQRAEAFLRTLGLWVACPTANEKVCEQHLNKK